MTNELSSLAYVEPFSLGLVAIAEDPRGAAVTRLEAWRAADAALDAPACASDFKRRIAARSKVGYVDERALRRGPTADLH